MSTIFFSHRFLRPFPVSFLFIEHVATGLRDKAEVEGESTELVVRQVRDSLIAVAGLKEPDQAQMDYALERLAALTKEAQEAEKDGPHKPSKPGFATAYMDWAASLDPQEACLVAAGFDFQQARHLYCEVDREDVLKLTESRMRCEWERIKIAYESSVYAFGGGYEGDDSRRKGKITEYDLSKDDEGGMAALAKLL